MKANFGAVIFISIAAFAIVSFHTLAQTATTESRITEAVDEGKLVSLAGNTHPMARPEFDRGAADPATRLDRMVLVLQRSPQQEAALEGFLAEQYDPKSPNFHHWLSSEEFGQLYGPSGADVATIRGWLENHGFTIDRVSMGRVTIEFSGTASQVAQTFHTEVHHYVVAGVDHIANASDPMIPEALAPVVRGIASLHDFFPAVQSRPGKVIRGSKLAHGAPANPSSIGSLPQFVFTDGNGNTHEDVTPYDFATIYNVLPLWQAGINGAGQTVAIPSPSDIAPSDVATFQSAFGLPSNPPTIIHNGADPGIVPGAQTESTLDVEWTDAVAPGATIVLVVTQTTATTFGGMLSASYIVDNETASIVPVPYGACEASLGTAGNAALNALWQQGASEGISIFVSAGDQGSAGCDNSDAVPPFEAEYGLQVNGWASTPYDTAVGGTDFLWQPSADTFWNLSNSDNGASATGYIPEIPWDPTCTSTYLVSFFSELSGPALCSDALSGKLSSMYQGLVRVDGGSGGVSACTSITGGALGTCSGGYAKPSWQTGIGVPADGKRDLPDVSLFASGGYPDGLLGSAYIFCVTATGQTCDYTDPTDIVTEEGGGTSFSVAAMAGVMALVQQETGASQGLATPVLYQLAGAENLADCDSASVTAGNACVFYDVTTGTNAQVCAKGAYECSTSGIGELTGYDAGTGYDLATGLGSLNVANLVNTWFSATLLFTVSNSGAITVTQGATTNNTSMITVTPSNGFTGDVTLGCQTTTSPASATSPVTCMIPSPVDITGAGAQMATLSANSTGSNPSTTAGAYAITVTAKNGNITQTTVVNVTVNAVYTLSAGAPSPSSVNPGGSATVKITGQAASSHYNGTVVPACTLTSSPNGASDLPACQVKGSIQYTNGTPSGSATATVTTQKSSGGERFYTLPADGVWMYLWGGVLLALLVCLGIPARRRRLGAAFGLIVITITLVTLSACGGGGKGALPGTTAGNYTFTIIGTGNDPNSASEIVTFTLIVK